MSVGKIIRWYDEKGFGFIESDDFDKEIFVHISAFPKDSQKPRIGDEVFFQVKNTVKGLQANRVRYQTNTKNNVKSKPNFSNIKLELEKPEKMLKAANPRGHTSQNNYYNQPRINLKDNLRSLFIIISILLIGYLSFQRIKNMQNDTQIQKVENTIPIQSSESVEKTQTSTENFVCDARKTCGQMTSKAEAQFFLAHCPDVKMDGDGDGDACEDQFGRK